MVTLFPCVNVKKRGYKVTKDDLAESSINHVSMAGSFKGTDYTFCLLGYLLNLKGSDSLFF